MKIPLSPAKKIFATSLGNGLEFFDLILYAFFSVYIAAAYFPNSDPLVSMMSSFLVFGFGYLARPLGAIVIGHYSDRKGRKPAMFLTFLLMGLSTMVIGITPSYAQIGIAAPVIIILARFVQGFSAGGEVGTSTTLLVELAGTGNRGFYGSWQIASQGVAGLLASLTFMLLVVILPESDLQSWGWRIPFVLGILIAPIGLYIRSKLEETATHLKPCIKQQAIKGEKKHIPLREVCAKYYKEIFAGVLLMIGTMVPSNLIYFYLPNHAISILKLDRYSIMLISAIANIVLLFGAPLAGILSDKFGRIRLIMISRIYLIILTYPAFWLLNTYPSIHSLFWVILLLAIGQVIASAVSITMLSEIFPRHLRTTGLSLVYSLGASIFGGFAVPFAIYLHKATGSPNAPAIYIITGCILSIFAFKYLRETSQHSLN